MRNLLKAAFRQKRHSRWFIYTFLTLIGLTIVNQLEMATLGMMANRGVEFFSLFGAEDELSKEQVDHVWSKIDKKHRGVVTREDVSSYVYHREQYSPIKHLLERLKLSLQKSDNRLVKIVFCLLLIAILKGLFLFFSRYTTRVLAIKISKDLREQYFSHIQTLSMSFYQKYNIGSLSTRVVGDANQIALSINSWVTNYLHTPFVLLSTLSICLYLSWQLSLVIFVGVPLLILPVKLITRKVRQITRALQKNQESFASVLIDFLAGIQTVKIFSMEKFTFEKYRQQNDEMERLECRTNKYDLLTRPILHFVTTLCLVLIVFVGLYCLKMPLAELIVFCGLLLLVYDPVRRFADENGNVQRGIMAAERLFEVMSLEPEILDDPKAQDILSFEHSLVFDRVWFRYHEEWVLKDVSFTINKGETVAIIGTTGSGKSTILQLFPRLYEVEKGTIYLDGKPLQSYTQSSLRALIAYVPQKPFLFHDTIRANILYGQEISDEAMIEASKRAHAHEFVSEMPQQYDSLLLEMGKSLSGGQQQRLAIARALARKSPILILDEATSSLDGLSERYIKEAIEELHGEMTQVIVAHRLSTIEHADRIIFIERGVKLAEGTKDQLLQICPPFRALWEVSRSPVELSAALDRQAPIRT